MQNATKHIPLKDCLDKGFYRLDARNFSYGVFNKEKGEFVGIRSKFNDRFLDGEDHWDIDGTARPLEFFGLCDVKEENLFTWLEEKTRKDY
jgi:hypothetical protein